MTPPAIEDLQPVQAKMAAAISLLYEAVAEAARLELSVDALQSLLTLIETTQKNRDELLKECSRPEPKGDIPMRLRGTFPVPYLGDTSNHRLEELMRQQDMITGDDIRAAFRKVMGRDAQ